VPEEFAAALLLCRRRRFGPFAAQAPDAETRRKWLAALARAGFPGEVARRALATPRAEAEALLAPQRR
jgi:regulatory protein